MDNAQAAWLLSAVPSRSIESRTRRWAGLFVTAALLVHTRVNAETEAGREAARQAYAQAEKDEAAGAYARALDGYDAAHRLGPSTTEGMRAERRASELRAHAEGDFVPLAALERVRRDPALAVDANAIDALVRDADRFPAGLVRVEAWVLAADAYDARLGRPADAMALWQRIAGDALAAPVVARSALGSLARHHLANGDPDAAAAVANDPRAGEHLVRDVTRGIRRIWIHRASIGVLALAALGATLALGRAARRGGLRSAFEPARTWTSLAVAYAAWIALLGGCLAHGYDQGSARPFLYFGLALVPLLVVARAWAAAGSPHRAPRAARATLCAAGALAAAFLVLERVDATYLDGLGL